MGLPTACRAFAARWVDSLLELGKGKPGTEPGLHSETGVTRGTDSLAQEMNGARAQDVGALAPGEDVGLSRASPGTGASLFPECAHFCRLLRQADDPLALAAMLSVRRTASAMLGLRLRSRQGYAESYAGRAVPLEKAFVSI